MDILTNTGINIEVTSSKNGQTRRITTAAARDAPDEGAGDSDIANEDDNVEDDNVKDLLAHMDIPSPAPTWKATTRGTARVFCSHHAAACHMLLDPFITHANA